ncbi:MAG: inorganic phosphate transporter [Bacteroidales bacterium]|jgi:phosphate/sulfate permease|nr:inorganic phosphate transporter [Bacteroidales bacterium]
MNVFLIIIVVLFALAITDLIVGVSNDAVNFLNSAIGSRTARFRNLMIITSIGIILGAVFSGGMMEVARKGIFHPEHFFFDEIMFMFLAVMLTDIILLDTFNSLGMPTSTTVSIVFELLGAAVAMSLIKISQDADALSLGEYINTQKALAIILGILLSVVVAFTIGAIVQYFSRLLFSFNYEKRIKYFGGIFGGLALTAISFFMIAKGIKNAPFMTPEVKTWVAGNTMVILGGSFVFWTIFLQVLHSLFKLNILKFIVLAGTMGLAMAFASNDLVNFIGVPLAGLDSYQNFIASGSDPSLLRSDFLTEPVQAQTYLLIIAGVVMAVTLWFSRKARRVVKTSVDLARQDEGEERFQASKLARGMVRASVSITSVTSKFLPAGLKRIVSKQFEPNPAIEAMAPKDRPAFDMIRASVNLVVASVLIAIGTSLKLPLSTTYVTFMVAMGTSLADRAWGRESAVYRINGVISVIGGWFLTAFLAFTVAFILLLIINFGGAVGIAILVFVAAFVIYRTYRAQKNKDKKESDAKKLYKTDRTFKVECRDNVSISLADILEQFTASLKAASDFDRKKAKKSLKNTKVINKSSKALKDNIYQIIRKLDEEDVNASMYYVQVIDYLRESTHSLRFIAEPVYEHIANNHKPFSKAQQEAIQHLIQVYTPLHQACRDMIMRGEFSAIDHVKEQQDYLYEEMGRLKKEQLKRIKKGKDSTKASVLFIDVLQETTLMSIGVVNVLKSYRDFMTN